MKRPLFMALLALALVALVGAGALAASIVNSKHDLSSGSTNGGIKSIDEPQVCVFCHTPHSASTTSKPLWNHTTTTANFTMYSNTTIEGTVDPQPSGGSELCLSCHDGSVAINSILNPASTTGNPTLTDPRTPSHLTADNRLTNSTALLDTNLSNDHPVSITYAFGIDQGLKDPATFTKVRLFNNKVQCGSCHNVHDPQYTPFLRRDNTGSALCLECHNK